MLWQKKNVRWHDLYCTMSKLLFDGFTLIWSFQSLRKKDVNVSTEDFEGYLNLLRFDSDQKTVSKEMTFSNVLFILLRTKTFFFKVLLFDETKCD